jgi:hypothetical protein
MLKYKILIFLFFLKVEYMAPYYRLYKTNQKKIINNLLKCQQSFYNVDNSDIIGFGAEAIRNCKGSIYNTNNGLYDINALETNNLDNSNNSCCPKNDYEGKQFTSQSTTTNRSYLQRTATYLKSARGGKPVFVYFNLGEPFVVNYLGRVEGQSGGSGAPLRNRF